MVWILPLLRNLSQEMRFLLTLPRDFIFLHYITFKKHLIVVMKNVNVVNLLIYCSVRIRMHCAFNTYFIRLCAVFVTVFCYSVGTMTCYTQSASMYLTQFAFNKLSDVQLQPCFMAEFKTEFSTPMHVCHLETIFTHNYIECRFQSVYGYAAIAERSYLPKYLKAERGFI